MNGVRQECGTFWSIQGNNLTKCEDERQPLNAEGPVFLKERCLL